MSHSWVFLCGAHSTGKTTLAKELSKKFNVSIIDEIARGIILENGWKYADYDPKGNPDNFLYFNMKILERKFEQLKDLNKDKSYVIDRACDPLAYIKFYLGEKSYRNFCAKNQQILNSIVQMLKISSVFLLQPKPELLKDDGTRVKSDLTELLKFSQTFKEVFNEHNIPYTVIDVLSMDERVSIVTSVCNLS